MNTCIQKKIHQIYIALQKWMNARTHYNIHCNTLQHPLYCAPEYLYSSTYTAAHPLFCTQVYSGARVYAILCLLQKMYAKDM